MLTSQKTWVQQHLLIFALWCQYPVQEEAAGPSKGVLLYLGFTSPEVVPHSAEAVLIFQ